jgi:hypothetical protein
MLASAFLCGYSQFVRRLFTIYVFLRIKDRKMPADNFFGALALESSGSRISGNDLFAKIQN